MKQLQIIHKLNTAGQKLARDVWYSHCMLLIKHHYDPEITLQLIDEYLEKYDLHQSIITILETKPVTREEFRMITCEHIPSICEDSGQAEWNQGELDDLYDALTTGDKHIIPDIEAFLEGRGYVKKNSN